MKINKILRNQNKQNLGTGNVMKTDDKPMGIQGRIFPKFTSESQFILLVSNKHERSPRLQNPNIDFISYTQCFVFVFLEICEIFLICK